jgi:hypothetical protein
MSLCAVPVVKSLCAGSRLQAEMARSLFADPIVSVFFAQFLPDLSVSAFFYFLHFCEASRVLRKNIAVVPQPV